MTDTYVAAKNYLVLIEDAAKKAKDQKEFKRILHEKGFDRQTFRHIHSKQTLLLMTPEEKEDVAKRIVRIDKICKAKELHIPEFTGWEKFMLICVSLGLVAYVGTLLTVAFNKNLPTKEKLKKIGKSVAEAAIRVGTDAAIYHRW